MYYIFLKINSVVMNKRRVVVTGIGIVSPLGANVKTTWENIKNSKSGIGNITYFDTTEMPESISKVAGQIKRGEEEGQLDINKFVERKDQKKMDKFIQYAIAAATEAVEDSGWKPQDEQSKKRTGVIIGSGIGGLETIQETCKKMVARGIKRISPFFIPASLINLASGHVSIKYGFRGPNHSVVTACATGSHSIGDAGAIIERGDADVMIAGGAEAAICELGIGGFSAMNALSTKYNNNPTKASRPWDKDRDGFVMGEGSGILVLEEFEHAKKRGAKIYGELVGYGLTGDAYHMSAPETTGAGQKSAVKMALKKAELNPENIDYINAHGTSTPAGDGIEFNSVKDIFSNCLDKLHMSSTKSATGHLLGAAGAIEGIFSLLAMRDSILPPTLNLENVDENCQGIDLVPLVAKEKELKYVASNSFGFGGTNACLIFKKI
jgi:3-oxoacyl-[acyl-carrier-protein] synthase II